jgi:AraC-like DNA-binding protein
MQSHGKKSSGAGLERSCSDPAGDWLRSTGPEDGVEYLEAWFRSATYRRHRHDTYAICVTTGGVQAFYYRGTTETSTTGQVVVLHPDELHDGYAATDAGYGYRQIYIEPALIFEAVQVLRGHPCSLPFVRTPVVTSSKLSQAVTGACEGGREPIAIDGLIVQVAEGLLEADRSGTVISIPRHLDVAAVRRACQFLDAEKTRVVRSAELEAVTGLTRYDLARQFRLVCGTSPYHYLLMRRLDAARQQLTRLRPAGEVARDSGFADQAHFTRMFKAAFGLTPAQYRALRELPEW